MDYFLQHPTTSEDDTLHVDALDQVQGFDFLLSPHVDRRCRRLGVHHRAYTARVLQRGGGAPVGARPILPQQLEQALERAIRQQVARDPEVRPDDFLYVPLGSNRLRSNYNSARVTVRSGKPMVSEPDKSWNRSLAC